MRTAVFFAMFFFAVLAQAGDGIAVSGGWIRAMPPVAKNSAGYLAIENRGGKPDVLLGVRIDDVAGTTEMHEMKFDGDTMLMRQLEEVPVPAHGKATFEPGGMHLMLIGLKRPLKVGERIVAVLRFRDAGEKRTTLAVRPE